MANNATSWLVGAVALIVIGIGLEQRFFGGAGATALNETVKPEATAAPPPTDARTSPVVSSKNLAPVATSHSEGSESRTLPSVNSDSIDPDSVIGRPFAVSASVERLCRQTSRAIHVTDNCDEVHALLSQTAQDPRDPAWATDMEATLRYHVMTDEPPGFSIRSLECRTSHCVAEVVSTVGHFNRELQYGSPLDKELFSGNGLVGYETNEDGARVTVTLLTYSRR